MRRLQVTSAAYLNFSPLAGLAYLTSIFRCSVSLITILSYKKGMDAPSIPQTKKSCLDKIMRGFLSLPHCSHYVKGIS